MGERLPNGRSKSPGSPRNPRVKLREMRVPPNRFRGNSKIPHAPAKGRRVRLRETHAPPNRLRGSPKIPHAPAKGRRVRLREIRVPPNRLRENPKILRAPPGNPRVKLRETHAPPNDRREVRPGNRRVGPKKRPGRPFNRHLRLTGRFIPWNGPCVRPEREKTGRKGPGTGRRSPHAVPRMAGTQGTPGTGRPEMPETLESNLPQTP